MPNPFREFTDHMVAAYERVYGAEPPYSSAEYTRLRAAFKTAREDVALMCAAWDCFMADRSEWTLGHDPKIFVKQLPKWVALARKGGRPAHGGWDSPPAEVDAEQDWGHKHFPGFRAQVMEMWRTRVPEDPIGGQHIVDVICSSVMAEHYKQNGATKPDKWSHTEACRRLYKHHTDRKKEREKREGSDQRTREHGRGDRVPHREGGADEVDLRSVPMPPELRRMLREGLRR